MPLQVPTRIEDLTGKTFELLTVVAYGGVRRTRSNRTYSTWWCQCECRDDMLHLKRSADLRNGHVTSCGCRRQQSVIQRNYKHGRATTPEYRIWAGIVKRCYNPKCKSYPDYGGRGIRMSTEWRNSFSVFLQDVGERPAPTYTLERKDNDGDYCQKNCKWTSKAEQARNRRTSRQITFRGRTQVLTQWAREFQIRHVTLLERLNRGWTVEAALTTRPDSRKGQKLKTDGLRVVAH